MRHQPSRFGTGKPPIAAFCLFGQHDINDLRIQSFATVMIDCCAQVLQLTSRGSLAHRPRILSFARFPGLSSAPGHILATSCAGHIGEHEPPPKLSKLHQPLTGFDRPSVLRHHITIIDIQNVDHRNISGVTAALAVELVLAGDMFGELSFRAFTLACRAASPDLACSVADDPGGSTQDSSVSVALLGFEPEPNPFGLTRHFFLISSIWRSVVNSLPATFSTTKVPRSLSRRSPDTVIPPAAKAILTAVSRGSGVSGPIRSGSNDELKRDIARSHWVRARQLLQTKKAARSRRCDLRSGAEKDGREARSGPISEFRSSIKAIGAHRVKSSCAAIVWGVATG